MIENLDAREVAEIAAGHFGADYHCAEAVVAATLAAIGVDATDAVAHATAFGGGFGKTHGEACGVLSGGLIVIGHLYGRRRPGDAWDLPAGLAAEFRKRFLSEQGTGTCSVLRERFGEARQMTECRELVRRGTVHLIRLLQKTAADAANALPVNAEEQFVSFVGGGCAHPS